MRSRGTSVFWAGVGLLCLLLPGSVLAQSCFQCPSEDLAGFPLGTSDTSTDPIFCSYPAFSGENPGDFYCTYSAGTGSLVTDNDAGFCPGTAVESGPCAPTPSPTTTGTQNPTPTATSSPTAASSPTATSTAIATATPTFTPTPTSTQTPAPPGDPCQTGNDCNSGFCVDGVCCISACPPPGQCALPGHEGSCIQTQPTPTLTPRGLALLVGALALVGIVPLMRRRHSSRS